MELKESDVYMFMELGFVLLFNILKYLYKIQLEIVGRSEIVWYDTLLGGFSGFGQLSRGSMHLFGLKIYYALIKRNPEAFVGFMFFNFFRHFIWSYFDFSFHIKYFCKVFLVKNNNSSCFSLSNINISHFPFLVIRKLKKHGLFFWQ